MCRAAQLAILFTCVRLNSITTNIQLKQCITCPSPSFIASIGNYISPFAVRTESGTVDHDPWRQWQAFTAFLDAATPARQAKSTRDSAFGFAPFLDAAERFTAAARIFLEGADKASAPHEAARNFTDFLREQFADFQMPWSGGVGPAAPKSGPIVNAPRLAPSWR